MLIGTLPSQSGSTVLAFHTASHTQQPTLGTLSVQDTPAFPALQADAGLLPAQADVQQACHYTGPE